MSEHGDEGGARTAVTDYPCPACKAKVGEPCVIVLSGVSPVGWSHDARILAPIYAALRLRTHPTHRGPRMITLRFLRLWWWTR